MCIRDRIWVGFSEEGLLCTLNDNGLLSGLNMKIEQWMPILDLKLQYTESYKNFWVAGVMDNELLVLRLPDHVEQPPIMRVKTYKRITFQIPLLDLKTNAFEEANTNESKENFANFEE